MKIEHVSRAAIDSEAWNSCVASSPNRIIYGYSWYLDAVTDLPNWKWAGLVIVSQSGHYTAVMPVPLRRKFGFWVVHQPLFCQFLGIYSAELTAGLVDAFAECLLTTYRYGSVLRLDDNPAMAPFWQAPFLTHQSQTHRIDLDKPYETIHHHYRADTRRNLRQARAARWVVQTSTDVDPLLRLFRQHHADTIPGGVGEWAYPLFTRLIATLRQRGMVTVQYALRDGQIEAGVVFVQDRNRIIYLFNAASPTGRCEHARTLLLDQLIRQQAGQEGVMLDFESPDKKSVQNFYRGFGAISSPLLTTYWVRLPRMVRWGLRLRRRLTETSGPFLARRTA